QKDEVRLGIGHGAWGIGHRVPWAYLTFLRTAIAEGRRKKEIAIPRNGIRPESLFGSRLDFVVLICRVRRCEMLHGTCRLSDGDAPYLPKKG
ncbi:MAG: hypothetical protein WBL95_27000, partial [Microcoleus sp.]